jgi:hypothetical protein
VSSNLTVPTIFFAPPPSLSGKPPRPWIPDPFARQRLGLHPNNLLAWATGALPQVGSKLQSGATMIRLLVCFVFGALVATGARGAGWADAVAKMPLAQAVPELNRTNAVALMLGAFRENDTVKALIFMPGATDELYFFDRDLAKLTNAAPTLLDAISAYTNQTRILVKFAPPFLLLHSKEDPLEPVITVEHARTAEKLASRKFDRHAFYNDAPWPVIKKDYGFAMNVFMWPEPYADSANHFYRHTFAGWNLTGMEALEAIVLSGKTTVTIERGKLSFAPNPMFMERPDGSAKRVKRLLESR